MRQTFPPAASTPSQQQQQFSSLQGINSLTSSSHKVSQRQLNCPYQTTGSGSILIEDVTAATKLLGCLNPTAPTRGNVLTFDDNDICIELEWNEIRKHLVLRRVSGDQTRYNNICHELIQNVL